MHSGPCNLAHALRPVHSGPCTLARALWPCDLAPCDLAPCDPADALGHADRALGPSLTPIGALPSEGTSSRRARCRDRRWRSTACALEQGERLIVAGKGRGNLGTEAGAERPVAEEELDLGLVPLPPRRLPWQSTRAVMAA